jgi:hypothetical protein
MKAKVIHRDQGKVVPFGSLETGDWFQEDGDAGISVKIGPGESMYLPFAPDDGVAVYDMDTDTDVTPIQVTIYY